MANHFLVDRSLGLLLALIGSTPMATRCSDIGFGESGGQGASSAGGSGGGLSSHAGSAGKPSTGAAGSAATGSGGLAPGGTDDHSGAGGADTAGASDRAGTGGTSNAGSSGSSGTAGHLTLSTAQLSFALHCPSVANFAPQTVTLTNTGNAPLTWSAGFTETDITPSTSTLAPSAHVDVTVTLGPISLLPNVNHPIPDIVVTTDVVGDVDHVVTVTATTDGYFITLPDTISFGDVPVGTSVTKIVPNPIPVGPGLGSSNFDFLLNGVIPIIDSTGQYWTLTFTPSSLGPESTTLTFGSFAACIFPPTTITATGNGT